MNTRDFKIRNTSLIPMTFHLRVPADGGTREDGNEFSDSLLDSNITNLSSNTVKTQPKEFVISPCTGTIQPQDEMPIRVRIDNKYLNLKCFFICTFISLRECSWFISLECINACMHSFILNCSSHSFAHASIYFNEREWEDDNSLGNSTISSLDCHSLVTFLSFTYINYYWFIINFTHPFIQYPLSLSFSHSFSFIHIWFSISFIDLSLSYFSTISSHFFIDRLCVNDCQKIWDVISCWHWRSWRRSPFITYPC